MEPGGFLGGLPLETWGCIMGLTVAREHQYASDIQNLEAKAWECLVEVANIVQIREEIDRQAN